MLGGFRFSAIDGFVMVLAMSFSAACGAQRPPSSPRVVLKSDTSVRMEVPNLLQSGTRRNCGPTAAAMLLGAYDGVKDEEALVALRDEIGDWSFENFAMRRVKFPGVRGGMTPADVLEETLNHFSKNVTFKRSGLTSGERRDLETGEATKRAMDRLQSAIEDKRPVLVLVQSGLLWPKTAESLHWVVVTGLTEDRVYINDPADGGPDTFQLSLFLESWRLNPFFRSLPFVDSYVGIVGDQPLPESPPPSDSDRGTLQVVCDDASLSMSASSCLSRTVRR